MFRGLVLGWYNQKNAGDDRLGQCILHWLHDHELTFDTHLNVPQQCRLDSYDYVLLGGGSIANEVAGVFKNMHSWIRRAQIPVFCAGLGVSDHEEFRHEFSAIGESGGHIWVRDHQSKINCRQPDRCVDVAPDLSWLFPMQCPDLERDGIAINLRPGGGPRKLDVELWKPVLRPLSGVKPWSLCFGKDNDSEILSRVLNIECSSRTFDPNGAARCELMIGMRFHAVIFSIQSGTPFLAITHTKKTNHLLQDLGLEYAAVPYDQPEVFGRVLKAVQSRMTSERLLEITANTQERASQYAADFKQRIEHSAMLRKKKSITHRLRRRLRILSMKYI